MRKWNKYFLSGIIMLIMAIIFVIYALNNPQKSFNINLTLLYVIYTLYIVVMIVMFILGRKKVTNK